MSLVDLLFFLFLWPLYFVYGFAFACAHSSPQQEQWVCVTMLCLDRRAMRDVCEQTAPWGVLFLLLFVSLLQVLWLFGCVTVVRGQVYRCWRGWNN